ncbi:MAG: sensor histidine kinase [Lachnospiraceae bacterium]|nr:sensor histidine kinase [Lachnospiraceae bacterium]
MNKERSIQQTTLLVFIVLLLFFGTIFITASSIITRHSTKELQKRASETALNNVSTYMDASMKNYNYASRLIMVNERVVHFLRANLADKSMAYEARMGIYEITNMYSSISHIDSVYVFRIDGDYANTGKGEYYVDFDNEEKERILSERGRAILAVNCNGMLLKKDDTPMLTLSRAIYDISSQELIGILVININTEAFSEMLSLQQAAGMCLLDTQGNYLCGDFELKRLYTDAFNSTEITSEESKFNGTRTTISGYSPISPLVIMCAGTRVAKALPSETSMALLMIITAFLISILFLIWFISRNIANPIYKLDEAMERTKSSGWLKRIDEQMPNNEIGRLAESYNGMIDYLNELFNRLIEEEKNNQKAEMRVLQEQIKPHFLYNTLETISYLAVQENAEEAHSALETLGSFYRNFLSKGDREIPLRRELKITQDYLALQKLRYGDTFTDEYDLDERTMDCVVPKLILQPLVENSIYHGVRPKGEQGIIRITTKMEEDGIVIKVYDSGVGMTREQIESALTPDKEDSKSMISGFGLHGTINRIRYYCDGDDVVKITSEPGEFTEFEIYIPKMKEVREGI